MVQVGRQIYIRIFTKKKNHIFFVAKPHLPQKIAKKKKKKKPSKKKRNTENIT